VSAWRIAGEVIVSTQKGKGSYYFPTNMLEEMQVEAERQDRSLSWILQQAWKIARGELRKIPGPPVPREQGLKAVR
jgi:uncharacterized small protein (TIGR04563 family)